MLPFYTKGFLLFFCFCCGCHFFFFNFILFCMLQRRCMKVCTNKVANSTADRVLDLHPRSRVFHILNTSGVWYHTAGFALCWQTGSGIVWSERHLRRSCCPGECGWRRSGTRCREHGLERRPRSLQWPPASCTSELRGGTDSMTVGLQGRSHGARTPVGGRNIWCGVLFLT